MVDGGDARKAGAPLVPDEGLVDLPAAEVPPTAKREPPANGNNGRPENGHHARSRDDVLPPKRSALRVSDRHLANLRASTLTDETIRLAEIYTETDRAKLGRLYGDKWRWGEALVFPAYVPTANEPYEHRLRPSNPGRTGAKYRSALNAGAVIYYTPRARDGGWYADAARALYWTEGEKKALALEQLELACLGLPGIWMFHDVQLKKRTKQWKLNRLITDHTTVADRDHIIIYDRGTPKGGASESAEIAAGRQLAGCLLDAGARSVRYVCSDDPEQKGVDDYCAAHGAERTRELIAGAKEIAPAPPVPISLKVDQPDALEPLFAESLPPGVALGTELALAHLLHEHHGHDLLHCAELDWLMWDGRRYAADTTGEASRRVQNIARRIELGAKDLYKRARQKGVSDDEKARLKTRVEEMERWARKAQTAIGIRKALEIAQTLMPVRVALFDADPMLLNVENGTIELTTGVLREHRRDDRLTKLAPVHYDVTAMAPRWSAFVAEVLPNPEVRAFVKRYLGYACTASVSEQCFVVALGGGNNGKSVMAETVRSVLGDYTRDTPTDTLMQCKHGRGVENDIARLRGTRFVTAKETEQGSRLDEARVKQLTGGDTVTARFLFKEHFEFVPSFKLWLYCNHRPVIVGGDDGIWRRLMLVLFNETVPPEKRDKDLFQKLRIEAPGILAWLVQGCVEWRRDGLQPPAAVRAASTQWREESDDVGLFVAECCVIGSFAEVKAGALYNRYGIWVKEQGGKAPLAPPAFSQRLTALGVAHGYVTARTRLKGRFWKGLGLQHMADDRDEPDFVHGCNGRGDAG